MTIRSWIRVLVAAAVAAAAVLVIANVYSFFGSKLGLLIVNTMWVVGLAGVLVSLVAMMVLMFTRHRRGRA